MADGTKVISGSGAVYVAAETVAIPNLTGNPTSDFSAFTPVGYTDDGVEIDYSAKDTEIRVDEESFPIDVLIDTETASISVKMAETGMDKLFLALTGATFTGGDTIVFGGLARPNIFRVGFSGPSPDTNKTRELILFRCYAKSALKMHYKRNAKVMYNVQFVALADSTQPAAARAGRFHDF
jgi:hypothetical protein